MLLTEEYALASISTAGEKKGEIHLELLLLQDKPQVHRVRCLLPAAAVN